ncbi:unnamed protein product [Cladocopium goreaui]|uniref:Uncharacterized protein n=1 Tax=Cladocopium goreaui TaxID=2562237 RepID=A0A9P1GCQ3_9DINO|nr:unnamed protein product [Cladocopium goreaui]
MWDRLTFECAQGAIIGFGIGPTQGAMFEPSSRPSKPEQNDKALPAAEVGGVKRIAAIKAYCSHPKRAKTHIRKDKYEKNVNKYLYETSDTLEYNKEEEETVTHTLEFDVSGPSSAAFPTMREGLVEARETRSRRPKAIKDKEPTDDDDDDDDSAADVMDEQTSDTNEDGNSDDQMSTSRASKRKAGSASTVSKRRREDNDVFNVDEILNQILKTNAKMNSLIPRLTELGGDEAAKEIKQLEARKASLLSLHDGIAGLKAEYDADQTMSPECSKAAMDHKKLTRTLLKKNASTPGGRGGPDVEPKAKAKAKAKSDTRPGAKKGPKSKK